MMPQILNRVCYGTLNPTFFQANLLTITPAILPDYTRRKVRYCDYPAVVPSPSPSSVRGTYVRGLTDGDIFRLDIFEGSQYERRKVKIRVLTQVGDATGKGNVEGEELEVETYVWIAEKTDLEDGEWDFAEFRKKKLTKWIGRNEEYLGRLTL